MNDKLIQILMKERDELYPNGCPVQPRGCAKTYLYLSHFLRYTAYDFVCQLYKHMNAKVDLESAHKDINNYVVGLMPEPFL